MSKFAKWISNYWYHYKFRTILCLFFAVIIGVSVFEFATRETYDMKVYLYLSEFASSEVENALEVTVEEYCKMQGEEKNVCVVNLSYDPYVTDGEAKMSYASALAAEIRMKEDFIYITDDYRFKELNNSQKLKNVFEKNDEFNKFDKKAYSINGGNFEKLFVQNLEKIKKQEVELPELYISLLNAPENDSKNYDEYTQAKELTSFIIKKDK